jgi:hypothetical protein
VPGPKGSLWNPPDPGLPGPITLGERLLLAGPSGLG